MTKRLAFFALMLMVAVGMQAQSLNGTWKTTMTEDDQKMDFYFIFTQSTLTMKGVVSQFDPEVGTITVSVQVPCTYTRRANNLTVKTNPRQAKLNIDKMNFVGEIVSEFPQSGDLNIVSLTATKLTLRDDTGETLSFTKVR